jgi:hypothetical protein
MASDLIGAWPDHVGQTEESDQLEELAGRVAQAYLARVVPRAELETAECLDRDRVARYLGHIAHQHAAGACPEGRADARVQAGQVGAPERTPDGDGVSGFGGHWVLDVRRARTSSVAAPMNRGGHARLSVQIHPEELL